METAQILKWLEDTVVEEAKDFIGNEVEMSAHMRLQRQFLKLYTPLYEENHKEGL